MRASTLRWSSPPILKYLFSIASLCLLGSLSSQAGLPAGWRFVTALPQGNDLLAAWAAAPEELYVGGHGGVILRWDGQAWTPMPTPTQKTIHALHGLSASDIWAVGGDAYTEVQTNRSLILHYDGLKWTEIKPPDFGGTTYVINSVAAVAPNDVWAAIDGGTWPIHWDGKSWQFAQHPLPLEGGLKAVTAVGTNHVFFVGTHGQIVHLNNGKWEVEQKTETGSFSVNILTSVWAYDLQNVYAGGSWGQVYRRNDDGTWRDLGFEGGLFGDSSVLKLWGTSPTNVYLLGVTSIRHYDGVGKVVKNDYQGKIRLQWFSGTGAGDRLYGVGPKGVVHEFKPDGQGGGVLSPLSIGGEAELAIRLIGATACGADGFLVYGSSLYRPNTSPLVYFDGNLFQYFSVLPPGMNAQATVKAASATSLQDIVICWGNETTFERGVHHWDGAAWQPLGETWRQPTDAIAFWRSFAGTLYACGPYRVARWNGAEDWTDLLLIPSEQPDTVLNAIWGRSDGEIYVGAKNGRIYRYDGAQWQPEPTPGAGVIVGLSGDVTDTYAVGEGGLAWRRSGTAWAPVPTIEKKEGEDFTAIALGNEGVHAAQRTPGKFTGGGLGRLWRFSGDTAARRIEGLSQPLEALARTGSGHLYGVAANNFVITDQPAVAGMTVQRVALTADEWAAVGDTGARLRAAAPASGSALVAAWRVDLPAPQLVPGALGQTVLANQHWGLRAEVGQPGTILPPLLVSFSYDPARLPAGFTPETASLFRQSLTGWLPVAAAVDPVAHTVTASSATGLSLWTFGSKPGAPPVPNLSISALPASGAVIAWPASAAGYALEYRQTLSAGDAWKDVPTTPVQLGDSLVVTNQEPVPSSFYRLKQN